jgi:heat shock protein HslJ
MMRTRFVRTLAVGMLAVSIPLLAACSGFVSGTTALQGEWVLASGTDAEGAFIDPVRPITLEFEGDAVSGQAPCNPYSGVIVRGPGSSGTGEIEFGALTRSEIGCAEMEQNLLESRFFAAIEAVDRVAVSDDGERLELTGDDIFLSFDRSENREG